MKSIFARAGAGVMCAALLASCGGSDNGSLLLTVTVTGLLKTGLVLVNGNQTVTVSPSGGATVTATFPNLVAQDDHFDVKVQTNPLATTCVPDETTSIGSANYYNVSLGRIVVNCTTASYNLGGTISGLTQDVLVLANGANLVTVLPGASSFVFPTKVYDGLNYGVTVLTQPEGLTCTVANGTGTMPSGEVTNLQVSCVPKT